MFLPLPLLVVDALAVPVEEVEVVNCHFPSEILKPNRKGSSTQATSRCTSARYLLRRFHKLRYTLFDFDIIRSRIFRGNYR